MVTGTDWVSVPSEAVSSEVYTPTGSGGIDIWTKPFMVVDPVSGSG